MSRAKWKKLYHSLVHRKPKLGEPQERAAPEVLKEFESTYRLRLPESYKTFVEVVGPGEIGAYFIIYAPGYPNQRSGSLEAFLEFHRSPEILKTKVETYGDPAFIKRMVPFSSSIGGDVFVWDPNDVREKRKHEYANYILPDDQQTISLLATSFEQFIDEICLGNGFSRFAGPDWTVMEQFIPAGRRLKPKG